jgi:hypothetical protein
MQGLQMPMPESEYLPTPTLNILPAATNASSDSLSSEECTVQMSFIDHMSNPNNLAHRVGTLATM